MKMRWYCGLNADWGDVYVEPRECAGEGEVHLNALQVADWEDGLSPNVQCDRCGTVLTDASHYEIVGSESPRANPEMSFEPPYSDEIFRNADYVLYEGGAWQVVKTEYDEFDSAEQKLDIQWVGGPRMGKLVYATGVRASEVRSMSEMEVIAVSSMDDWPDWPD